MRPVTFSVPPKPNTLIPSDSIIFIDSISVGGLKMGYTTLEEAKKTIGLSGEISINTYKRKFRIDDKCYRAEFCNTQIADTTIGIYLRGDGYDRHTITTIVLEGKCKWKTKNNLGLGSTFSEIEKVFGKSADDNRNSSNMYIGYSWGNFYIKFYSTTAKTRAKSDTIKQIEIEFFPPILLNQSGTRYKNRKEIKCNKPCAKC